MKKYTALFAALTLVLALAGCGAETQTPMPGQSEQEEFTQNTETVIFQNLPVYSITIRLSESIKKCPY